MLAKGSPCSQFYPKILLWFLSSRDYYAHALPRLSSNSSSLQSRTMRSPFLISASVMRVFYLTLQPFSSSSILSKSVVVVPQKSRRSLARIWQKVWYFFSIFWWWLLHCSASRVLMKLAMLLKILSVLRRYFRTKWRLCSSRNQWQSLFSSLVQCPFWMFLSSVQVGSSLRWGFFFWVSSLAFFLARRMWLFLRKRDSKLQPGMTFSLLSRSSQMCWGLFSWVFLGVELWSLFLFLSEKLVSELGRFCSAVFQASRSAGKQSSSICILAIVKYKSQFRQPHIKPITSLLPSHPSFDAGIDRRCPARQLVGR